MGIGVTFSLCSLLFNVVLMFVFFSKKKASNFETKIYSLLLLSTVFGAATSLPCYYSVMYAEDVPTFAIIFSKAYLVFIHTWISLIDMYYLLISNTNISKDKYIKVLKYVFAIYYLVILALIFILPIEYNSDPKAIYTFGQAVDLTYIMGIMAVVILLYCLFKEKKQLKNKKYFPLMATLLIGTVAIILQKSNPSWLFMTTALSLVTHLMYHTIENPDMKMIEQLNIAKDQADKANMAKSDFLSSMSHEIRTPLNAIVGFSEAIDNSNSLEEAKENAKDVISASNTLLEIVNGVLDISKIEAGKLEIVNSDYNTYELLNNVTKLLRNRMEEKGLEFKVYIAGDIPAVLYGDHANLKKVITNILTNACKYTDKGYVEFKVSCVNNSDTTRLLISVEDTGRGIKKENIDKLFTRFQRLDEDRNTTIEGTGLGLAITKKILDLMGGTIVVQSVYGSGSKFTIALDQKIKSMILDVKEKKEIKDEINLTNKKILIVDDNKLNLKVAAKFLSNYKPIIETVESGFECIDKIKNNNKYDLILMDDMMPKMSGVETLNELKKITGFNIPVVALTANAISGMRDKYIKDGFNDYIAKPIDKQELKRVLSDLVPDNYKQSESILGEIPNELFIISDEDIEKVKEKEISAASQDNLEIKPEIEKSIDISNVKNNDYLIKNGIDISKGLELLGDIETYDDMLDEFYSNLDDRLSKLELYKNDMPNYAIEVHALKSDSKYLGFTKLVELAYDHEMKSKANDVNYINNTYDSLMTEVNKIKEIVKNYLGK